jgi:hypothetical protein
MYHPDESEGGNDSGRRPIERVEKSKQHRSLFFGSRRSLNKGCNGLVRHSGSNLLVASRRSRSPFSFFVQKCAENGVSWAEKHRRVGSARKG